jgi:hypothetical protein
VIRDRAVRAFADRRRFPIDRALHDSRHHSADPSNTNGARLRLASAGTRGRQPDSLGHIVDAIRRRDGLTAASDFVTVPHPAVVARGLIDQYLRCSRVTFLAAQVCNTPYRQKTYPFDGDRAEQIHYKCRGWLRAERCHG